MGKTLVAASSAIVWLAFAGAGTGCTTGTSEASPGDGGADGVLASPGDSTGPPDGAADSLNRHAGLCNDVSLPIGSPQISLVDGAAPAQSGGAIHDGRYELESILVYVADGGPSVHFRNQAIEISGHQWASVSYFDSAAIAWYNDEATLSGNSVSLRRTCGDAGGGVFFGTSGTYTATDSELIVSFAVGAPYGDGTAVLTFRRSPGPDAGADI